MTLEYTLGLIFVLKIKKKIDNLIEMKQKLLVFFLVTGWILLFGMLLSIYVLKSFNTSDSELLITSIEWTDFPIIYEGILRCNLLSEEKVKRQEMIRETIFPYIKNRVEHSNGFTYYFEDRNGMLEKLMEFIRIEKECCSFFRFDLSVLPFNQGLALQISGMNGIKEFLLEFES